MIKNNITHKEKIYSDNYYTITLITGKTTFDGCQCFKDCNCAETFKSEDVRFYLVSKLWGKHKSYSRTTEQECYLLITQQKNQLNNFLKINQ